MERSTAWDGGVEQRDTFCAPAEWAVYEGGAGVGGEVGRKASPDRRGKFVCLWCVGIAESVSRWTSTEACATGRHTVKCVLLV